MGAWTYSTRVRLDGPTVRHLCVSAARYAMGRNTGASDDVAEVIRLNAARLDEASREAIVGHARHLYGSESRINPEWASAIAALNMPAPVVDDGWFEARDPVTMDFTLATAWRWDAEQSRDEDAPAFWMRLFEHLPDGLVGPYWRRLTMRDMLWDGLLPLDEPIGSLQECGPRLYHGDPRWVGFYRLLREQDSKEGQA